MKKLFIALSMAGVMTGATSSHAQSFHLSSHDTVRFTITGGSDNIYNRIIVPSGSGPVTLKWNVIGTSFPSDWLSATGICDNVTCYSSSSLWPSGTTVDSAPYAGGATGDFHMVFTGPITHAGTFYYAVRFFDPASFDADTAVFALTAVGPTSVANTANQISDISVYPNPATSEVNIVFEKNSDIKNVALFNNIGRMVAVYRTNGTSANLNLENVASGIYFARLINSQGNVVATRRFTKQ